MGACLKMKKLSYGKTHLYKRTSILTQGGSKHSLFINWQLINSTKTTFVIQNNLNATSKFIVGSSFTNSLGIKFDWFKFKSNRDVRAVATTKVSQFQYELVTGKKPSHFSVLGKKELLPVENISWHDAMEFCHALNKQENLILPYDWYYSLPTVSLWETCKRRNPKFVGENDHVFEWCYDFDDEPCHSLLNKNVCGRMGHTNGSPYNKIQKPMSYRKHDVGFRIILTNEEPDM